MIRLQIDHRLSRRNNVRAGESIVTKTVTVSVVVMQGVDLAVGGTTADDHIQFTPGPNAGDIEVTLNGVSLGTSSSRLADLSSREYAPRISPWKLGEISTPTSPASWNIGVVEDNSTRRIDNMS